MDALELYRRYPNVCVLRTFSKAYGLAGLRVGYAIARAPLAEGLRRTAIPFGVNRMAQTAAAASLAAHDEMRARTAEVRAERTRMIAALRGAGWILPESQANFVWLRCGTRPGRPSCLLWRMLTSSPAATRTTESASRWLTVTPTIGCLQS